MKGHGDKARFRCFYQTMERRAPGRLRQRAHYHVRRQEGFRLCRRVPDELYCLEVMSADELRAYDLAWRESVAAVSDVLNGKDNGAGVANEPWEGIRRRLLALLEGQKEKIAP